MDAIRCPECNLLSWASDPRCKRCGLAFQQTDPAADVGVQGEVPADTQEYFVGRQEFATSSAVHSEPVYQRHTATHPKPKIRLAVFSMIFGILGMPPFSTFGGAFVGLILALAFGAPGFVVGLLLVFAFIPAGLIAGIVALRRSNRLPLQFGGKGFAIAGIICSSIALLILPVIAAIAIPNLMASRRAANEGVAVSKIRKLASAEDIFMEQLGSGHCGDLDVMTGTNLIDPALGKSESSGYRFQIVKRATGGCEIYASPLSTSSGNRSFFYSTSEKVIRATSERGRQAGMSDPRLEDLNSQSDELPTKIALERGR